MTRRQRLLRAALFLPALLISASALETEPRISSILPGTVVPYVYPEFLDLNGDRMPDLVFPASPEPNAPRQNSVWLRNLGRGTFAPPSVISRPLQSDRFASFADVDADGRPDVFTVMRNPSGDGSSFPVANLTGGALLPDTHRTTLMEVSASWWVAAELDGQPGAELAAVMGDTESDGVGVLSLYTRSGQSSLHPWETAQPMRIPWQGETHLAPVDMEGDGDLDFVASSTIYNPDAVLFERRPSASGTPAEFTPHPVIFASVIEDLDGDGCRDLLKSDQYDITYQRVTTGAEGLEVSSPVSRSISLPDDCTWTLTKVQPRQGAPATLIFTGINLQNGLSTWIRIAKVTFGQWQQVALSTVSTTAGANDQLDVLGIHDLNGDGYDDLVLSVGEMFPPYNLYDSPRLVVAWGSSSGFRPGTRISKPALRISTVFPADIDGNGTLDLIANTARGQQYFMRNNGNGGFSSTLLAYGLGPVGGVPVGTRMTVTACADMDGDHIPDLVVSYYNPEAQASAIGIALGDGYGNFSPPVLPVGALDFATDSFSFNGQLIDWDGDGDLDLIGFSGWRENLGGGYLAEEWHPLIGGYSATDFLGNPTTLGYFKAADVDGDGHTDIMSLVYAPSSGSEAPMGADDATIGFGFTDRFGGIEQIVTAPIRLGGVDFLGNPTVPGNAWIADLNKDGFNDLVTKEVVGTDFLGNPYTALRWRRNPGNASSRNPSNWVTTDIPVNLGYYDDLVWADFDGDGNKDLCAPSFYIKPTPAGPALSPVYDFLQGNRQFLNYSSRVLAYGDFDGDGDLDTIQGEEGNDVALVRNLRVDERSAVSRTLRTSGVLLGEASNPEADPDGDGRTNAEELLTGSDPSRADRAPFQWLTPRVQFAGGIPQVTFRSRTDAEALGFHYILESSTDLSTWAPVDTANASSQAAGAASWQDRTVSLPATGPQRFFRVRSDDGSSATAQ